MFRIVNAGHVIRGIVIAIVRKNKINQARKMGGARSADRGSNMNCREQKQHSWFLGTIEKLYS